MKNGFSELSAVVVGTGFIGPVHVEALRRLGVHVAGIVGSSADKTRMVSEQLGLASPYETFEAVLADSSIDVIHLATPNRLHFGQTKAALEAGKHVLCEKPLAMNATESAELVRLAASTNRAAGVCYNIRYYPLCCEARERLQRQDSGRVMTVFGSYVQDWLLYASDFNWRVLADDGGPLRAVADIGTHWLDLVQFVMDDQVDSVCADLHTIHPIRQRPRGGSETFSGPSNAQTEDVAVTTEDAGCVMLRFRGGAGGCLWVSQATAGRKNRLQFEIAASNQSVAWDSQSPNSLWVGNRSQANESLVRDPALVGAQAARFCQYPGGHNEGFPDSFKQLFRAFYEDVLNGTHATSPTFPTLLDGHREIQLCEAILRSHRERRWVEVEA